MNHIEERLHYIIENLTRAVNVCDAVDDLSDDYTKQYPYATGWSQSTMNNAIDDLNRLVTQLREGN